MGKVGTSFELARSSANVLQQDRELVVLPLLGFVTTVATCAVFGAIAWGTVDETTVGLSTEYQPSTMTYAVGFIAYFVITSLSTYFTAALVAGALERLRGGDPTVSSALRAANARLSHLLGWSLLVTTVGLLLQAIEERAGFIGKIVINLIGAAWRIVTWLAIPIVLEEGTGPIESVKRSAELFKRTWGENLAAQVGFGVVALVLLVPGVVVGAFVATAAPVVGIPLLVLWIGAVFLGLSALNGIYRAALYLYATTGEVPPGFAPEAFTSAFSPKKRSRLGL